MKYFLTLIFFASALNSFGQDTTFYNNDFGEVSAMNEATYYEVVIRDPADTNRAQMKSYDVSGQLKSEENYSDYPKKKRDGKFRSWYESGQLHTVIDYKNGFMFGQILTYWENGQPKRIDNYYDGKFVDGKCLTSTGADTVHFAYEIMPQYPGGIDALWKYLSHEIRYPRQSKLDGITGRVVVGFVVDADGTISNVKIVRSVADDLDQESIRVVKSMRPWEPGMQDGKRVRVQFNLPISFDLK